jgi:SAM-dependent methyltransferase
VIDIGRNWDEAYISGSFADYWDILFPSQELVACVAINAFPKRTVALDIGCGAGREAVFLAQQGYHVIGVDLSAEALKIAKTRADVAGVVVDWRQGDVLSLPVESEAVDFVNDRGCFHHIPQEQRDQFVLEIARVLKPGGTMLLRGCCDEEEAGHFVLVTENEIDRYFGMNFSRGQVIPLQMATGRNFSVEGMKANLVYLRKKV